MIYQPILSPEDFTKRIHMGSTKESVHLDFKFELNINKAQDVAIDIASFANTYGGILLIGVSEKTVDGITTANAILPNLDFEKTRKVLNEKVRDFIKPSVKFETVLIRVPEGIVAAVNVEPSIGIVGVCTNKETQNFCFPYRTEFGNRYLEFGEVERRMSESQNRANYLKMLKYAPVSGCFYDVDLFPSPLEGTRVSWKVSVIENSDHEFLLQRNDSYQIQLPYSMIVEIWRTSTMDVQKFSIRLTEMLDARKNVISILDRTKYDSECAHKELSHGIKMELWKMHRADK